MKNLNLDISGIVLLFVLIAVFLGVIVVLAKEQTKRFESCLKETKDAKVCQLVMRY